MQWVFRLKSSKGVTMRDKRYDEMMEEDDRNYGDEPRKKEKTTEEEEVELLKIYLDDLKAIPPISKEEKAVLIQQTQQGDKNASKRLAESFLMQAIQLAAEYKGQGISLADLIQEANVGLMEAMLSETITEETILASIRKALENAVSEEERECETGEQLATRINDLNEAAQELAARHGKEATPEELAELLHLTVEEVREYMKISLDAINVEVPH